MVDINSIESFEEFLEKADKLDKYKVFILMCFARKLNTYKKCENTRESLDRECMGLIKFVQGGAKNANDVVRSCESKLPEYNITEFDSIKKLYKEFDKVNNRLMQINNDEALIQYLLNSINFFINDTVKGASRKGRDMGIAWLSDVSSAVSIYNVSIASLYGKVDGYNTKMNKVYCKGDCKYNLFEITSIEYNLLIIFTKSVLENTDKCENIKEAVTLAKKWVEEFSTLCDNKDNRNKFLDAISKKEFIEELKKSAYMLNGELYLKDSCFSDILKSGKIDIEGESTEIFDKSSQYDANKKTIKFITSQVNECVEHIEKWANDGNACKNCAGYCCNKFHKYEIPVKEYNKHQCHARGCKFFIKNRFNKDIDTIIAMKNCKSKKEDIEYLNRTFQLIKIAINQIDDSDENKTKAHKIISNEHKDLIMRISNGLIINKKFVDSHTKNLIADNKIKISYNEIELMRKQEDKGAFIEDLAYEEYEKKINKEKDTDMKKETVKKKVVTNDKPSKGIVREKKTSKKDTKISDSNKSCEDIIAKIKEVQLAIDKENDSTVEKINRLEDKIESNNAEIESVMSSIKQIEKDIKELNESKKYFEKRIKTFEYNNNNIKKEIELLENKEDSKEVKQLKSDLSKLKIEYADLLLKDKF